MPSIPKTQQYYPTLPISEFTDLYSKGHKTLNGKRAFIASYLPKTLRLSEALPFNNQYTLFVEKTQLLNSIDWEYQLYNNGERTTIPNFVTVIPSNEDTQYALFFSKDSVDSLGKPVADKLIVKCTAQLGPETIELEVEHDIVQLLDTEALNQVEEDTSKSAPHQGNPETTKYILNHLKDFLPNKEIAWNGHIIETDLSEDEQNDLLKIVIGIIYYNIQVSINETRGFDFLYNINQDRDKGIEAFLNEDKKNRGDYTNGLCRIPLHVLNEILTEIGAVPSFEDIDNGDGNAIYNILREKSKSEVNIKIEATKTKLESDFDRYIELFNLTLFPKSAIRLCALVVKYILEASKKNECKECKNKRTTWKDLTIAELSENPKFVWNILTLYYNGPVNKVKKYSKEAKKTKDLIWSPFTHTIVTIAPRIIKAYFAKRVVTKFEEETINGVVSPVYTFDLVRIDNKQTRVDDNEAPLPVQPAYDSILGRELYLVVETVQLRGEELTINVNPKDRTFNNSTANIEILSKIAENYATDITCTIGNTDDLRTNTLAPFSDRMNEYLAIDYKDKAIVKIRLKPETEATFTAWATHLSMNTGTLMMKGKLTDETECYYGNDFSETTVSGEFLSNTDKYLSADFRVVNRVVYEMYKDDDPWNFLPLSNGTRALIGKINNQFVLDILDGTPEQIVRKALYFYYDGLDYEHYFGEFDIRRIPEWRTAANGGPDPNNIMYLLEGTNLNEYNNRGVHINLIDNSPRDFVNLDCYSGLLAAMAVNNIYFLAFNGFSHADGSPAPSVSHKNGKNGDLRYLRTDRNGDACILTQAEFDLPMQRAFNESLFQYGWGRTSLMISENFTHNGANVLLPHCRHYHKTRVDVNYSTEDVVVNQNFPQEITAAPNGAALNVGDVISLVNPNIVQIAGVQYIVDNLNNRAIVAPLPAGATLAVGTRIKTPVRHNNHLHVEGFDPTMIHEFIQ